MPPGARYVGRGSKFGNCFSWRLRMRTHHDTERQAKQWAVDSFDAVWSAYADTDYRSYLEEIRGQDLACWCRLDDPCHRNVLLRLANNPR